MRAWRYILIGLLLLLSSLMGAQGGRASDPASVTPPQDPPALPDLTILYISRTPRYPAFKVEYPDGIPVLLAGTENDQRFPEPGEVVTLTAQIKNQGRLSTPPANYRWLLDGSTFASGRLPALAAGATASLSINWPWRAERHEFVLELDTAAAVAEISEQNNRLNHWTDALYLAIDVHPYIYAEFARRPNLVGSWSFEDWLQAQVAQMNQRLGAAIYPLTPAGIRDRVRIDQITVLDIGYLVAEKRGTPLYAPRDAQGRPPTFGAGALAPFRAFEGRWMPAGQALKEVPLFDGRWGFYVAPDDHDTPEDESRLSAESYAETYAGRIDWGLIHELTHQLGAIDLYHLNLEGASANPLSAADGRPLLLGLTWPNPGLMGGGDTSPYRESTMYSSHTARALNSNAGYRRGYYGEYLYDLPAQINLQIRDNRDQPAAGAQLDIFQNANGILGRTPVFSTRVDNTGVVRLPNRAFAGAGLTTATGHTLAPNPFGQIDVVGGNALLLARLRTPVWSWHEEYRWIRLTDLNEAFWAGQRDVYTITLATRYPGPAAPAPPVLWGDVEGRRVRLQWSLSSTPTPARYRVYRAVEPAFTFVPLASVGASTSYTDTLDSTSWYVVTVVDAAGRESGFSNVFRAPRLIGPMAIVVDRRTRQEIVLDSHYGGLYYREWDGDWIGRLGSQHLGFIGASGMSAGPAALMAIAQGRRVALLTSERTFVANFFIGSDRVNPDADAVSVLPAEPAPERKSPPPDDAHALLLARFDGDLLSHGKAPAVAENVTFSEGRFGLAANLGPASRLAYAPAAGAPIFQTEAGGIEFWLRPHWDGRDGADRALLDIGDGKTYRMLMVKDAGGGLWAWVEDYGRHGAFVGADARDWRANDWHHLAVTWNSSRLDLTIDGVLQSTHQWRHAITGTVATLWIGSDSEGAYRADADFDELRISDFPRWDTTDQGRLLLADRGQHRLSVHDLLGNLISVFGASGNSAGQFRSPTGLAWTDARSPRTLLVADQGNSRLQALDFDGNTLSNPRVVAAGLGQPTAIAVGPDGSWLVSDVGLAAVLKLYPDGTIAQVWTEPDDGHAGRFAEPRGLTVRPDGAVLVADTGNQRVVALRGAYPRPLYLPLLVRR